MPDRNSEVAKAAERLCLSNPSIIRFSCLGCCRVGVLLHLIERRLVRLAPLVEHFNRLREGPAKGRQFIFHLRRYDIVTAPMHKAALLDLGKV